MSESKQVIIPDSPEARYLAMLGSLNADLVDAAATLGLAEEYVSADNDHDRALHRHLVAQAVVTYGRCFTTSNVRRPLVEIVAFPPQFSVVHGQVMKLRNRTIAHSESDLEVSYAFADLVKSEGDVQVDQLLVGTTSTPVPYALVHRMRAIVAELATLLKVEIDSAKTALAASISDQARSAMWANGRQPRLVPQLVSEWDPDTRRPPYPTSHEIPVYIFEDVL